MTSVGAKIVNGQKVWFTDSVQGDLHRVKEYPHVRSRSDFYDAVIADLGLPPITHRRDVVRLLWSKTWDGSAWTDDPPRETAGRTAESYSGDRDGVSL